MTTGGCYATLNVFSDGRPSILQITSYNDPSGESFPSVIIRAETSAKTPEDLSGKPVTANVFVQANNSDAVWQAIENPLELTFTSVDQSEFSATVRGTLVNAETGVSKEMTGSLHGSFTSK